MKPKLLFFALLFSYALSNAQTTTIPDANFEQALIDLGYDAAPINGSVPTAQIDFIGSLDVSNKNISNLSGIEDFASLAGLDCNDNQIGSLNLSNNSTLIYLNCAGNNLSYLNVKNGNNTNFINFKVVGNPNLTCIEVDDAAYSTANWSGGIDSQMSFSEDCYTAIPDANFEQALIDLGYDAVLDGFVTTANIETLTTLDVSSKNISDLTGIEAFVGLHSLNSGHNQLTSIDVSHNTGLTILYTANNQLANIDLSHNTDLIELYLHNNQLTSLDLSQNTALTIISVSINQLTSLDTSNQANLISLTAYANLLTTLDLSSNTNLTFLSCPNNQLTSLNVKNGNNTNITSFLASTNPNLFCIEVDDAAYSTANWSGGIHSQTSFSEDCHYDETYVPDDNFEQALIDLGYDSGALDDYVPTANIINVTTLTINNKNIADLTGIEAFEHLSVLYCSSNQITTLDLSNNTYLTEFNCAGNNLHELNIKNNKNSHITLFKAVENPNLTCIEVDDPAYSTANWQAIDAQTSFNIDCHYGETYVPDNNFEQALIDLGYDAGPLDDYVPTANINTITALDVHGKSISDLTGIEDFVALDNLDCYSNNLTSLNIDNNTALTYLQCNSNNISSLNVTNNTALIGLNCNENNLSSLDITNNTALKFLLCLSNNLSSLDISNNLALEELIVIDNNLTTLNIDNLTALLKLECSHNNLSSLDVINNTALTILDCSSNNLSSLNLDNNTALTGLDCSTNNLTSLNLENNPALIALACLTNNLTTLNVKNGNNTIITNFYTTDNPNLYCIEVDDAAYSTANWTFVDAQTSFSEDCHYNDTYVPDDNFEQALIDLGYDSGALDDYVPTANIINVTTLTINNKNIADLTGIEAFEHLSVLDCSSNQITTLDLSNNTYLEQFNCTGNNLHELNIKNNKNTQITLFKAVENPNLTCVEVDDPAYSTANWQAIDAQTSFNIDCRYGETYVPDDNFEQALIDLGYDAGPLDDYVPTGNINTVTNLDVYSKNISDLTGIEDFVALTDLDCTYNNLTSLDVSANTALTTLKCYSNDLTSLDVSANTALTTLKCYSNDLTSLDVSANTALTDLICSYNDLTSLDVSANTVLIGLACGSNDLTSLDVSANTALTTLKCYSNALTSLDVSANTALTYFSCSYNALTSLDVSANTALTYFSCSYNALTSLDVKNGNNTNITSFYATYNPNLTCIEVDDAAYSTANWTNIDAQTSFSEDCHYNDTYVPDDNFEQALIDLGYDAGPLDDYVPTDNINTIISLNVSSKNISDLTGIEDFVALEELLCLNNQITNLDISHNTALKELKCYSNSLTNLDVSSNTALTLLHCYYNDLTVLDVSNNVLLEDLRCGYSQISTIDLTNNAQLKALVVGYGVFTDLDVSNNPLLELLRCESNFQLTSLNVKNGNNTIITGFYANSTPNLTCIEVDDEAYSTTNWTNIDAQTSFSEDCSANIVTISPKLYLQGPLINPATAGLMNDNLRSGSYIPTTSPYADTATCDASVFNVTGNNAIVDWVWIELRDANDNTAVVAARSALIQRDGDVVDVDGTSPVSIETAAGDYYLMVSHRNHLGVLTNSPISLSGTNTVIDLTNNINLINGGTNGIATMNDGKLALFAGDFNGDGQVQNSDKSSVETLRGSNGYSDADINMNSEVQNSDIQNYLNPNTGKGIQFSRMIQLKLYAKRNK